MLNVHSYIVMSSIGPEINPPASTTTNSSERNSVHNSGSETVTQQGNLENYEPPKLMKFEKLSKLIVSGE